MIKINKSYISLSVLLIYIPFQPIHCLLDLVKHNMGKIGYKLKDGSDKNTAICYSYEKLTRNPAKFLRSILPCPNELSH